MGKKDKGTTNWIMITVCGILFINLLMNPFYVKGKTDDTKVLVVYSSKNGEIDEHQRLLNLLISHFTTNMTFVSSGKLQEKNLNGVTHLFYYGQEKEHLSGNFLRLLDSYTGPFIAIGHNVEQLQKHFTFLKPAEMVNITEVLFPGIEEKKITVDTQITKVSIDDKARVIVEAKQGDMRYPLFVQHKDTYYYATNNLFPPMSNFLAEAMHEVFEVKHTTSKKAFLRLEDIHPKIDPKHVLEIAHILKQKNIPYMVSVVPVYINPETEEEYHLSDAPELVEALKYIQNNGGSLIFHGYTDQYNQAETGEGFEFWNVEKNMPLYQDPTDTTSLKKKEDFATNTDYENYIQEKMAFETEYIQEKLNKGMKELIDYGLYPLAFEAPHYAMSQNGYKVISEYFSTLVGQVQLTDEDWRIMSESPYVSSPSFLQGTKLLPETIRYVRYDDPASIQEMKKRVKDFTAVRDGVIGGFYHPFLGVVGLVDLVNEMEKIPNIEWIDLKKMNNTVKVNHIQIRSEKGEIFVTGIGEHHSQSKESGGIFYSLINLFKDNIFWILMGAGLTFFMAVLSFIILKRTQRSVRKTWYER